MSSYQAAGVDILAGERAVDLMRSAVSRTSRPEVLGGLGGFAGLFALDLAKYPQPVLASSTDGVGTKIAIAQALDRHDTVGIDLVAMVVDDLVVAGAEPLFLTDYIATGRIIPEKIAAIVSGIAEGCVRAGCALIGGETAEHPGLMRPDEYDLCGTGVGVVNADAVLGGDRVQPGDVLLALASSGLHSNGYSLVRHVLFPDGLAADGSGTGRAALGASPLELGGRTLGDELLEPTRIYARDCLALAAHVDVHAFAHVTGGGLAGNLARVIPAGLIATVDRAAWTPPAVFDLIATAGGVSREQMELTFNLGVGMVAIVSPGRVADAIALLRERAVPAWMLGTVRAATADGRPTAEGAGQAEMSANYPGKPGSWGV